jgi:hypothetical protein
MQIKIAGIAARGSASFTQGSITVKETDPTATVEVSRVAGFDETLSVNYQLFSDSAQIGEDVAALNGTVTWQEGDAFNKSIEIHLLDDDLIEELESLQLILSADDPTLLGNQTAISIIIRDDDSNQPPSADAGMDSEVNTRQSVLLIGSGEDPEQFPLTYQWQQISGESVNVISANTNEARFTSPSIAATLEFGFTVTDDFNVSTTDVMTVTVIKAPEQPTTNTGGSGGSLYAILILLSIGCLRYRKI